MRYLHTTGKREEDGKEERYLLRRPGSTTLGWGSSWPGLVESLAAVGSSPVTPARLDHSAAWLVVTNRQQSNSRTTILLTDEDRCWQLLARGKAKVSS